MQLIIAFNATHCIASMQLIAFNATHFQSMHSLHLMQLLAVNATHSISHSCTYSSNSLHLLQHSIQLIPYLCIQFNSLDTNHYIKCNSLLSMQLIPNKFNSLHSMQLILNQCTHYNSFPINASHSIHCNLFPINATQSLSGLLHSM